MLHLLLGVVKDAAKAKIEDNVHRWYSTTLKRVNGENEREVYSSYYCRPDLANCQPSHVAHITVHV